MFDIRIDLPDKSCHTPLDGGKMLLEVIQLITRKPLSVRFQTIVSYIGLAFFLFIFLFALHNDVIMIMGRS